MKKFSLILVIVVLALLWGGGQALYTVIKNPEPLTMTCEEYAKQRPDREWVKLTDCALVIPEAAFIGHSSITQVYVPVVPGAVNFYEDNPKVSLVLNSRDEGLRQTVRKLIDLDKVTDEAKIEEFMVDHYDDLFPRRNIEGTVKFGIELDSDERKQLSGLSGYLAKNFVIVADGEAPDLKLALIMFGAGIALALLLAWLWLRPGRHRESA
ncbi:MAG: hypothetical protein P9L99_02010 [Candidatus Lernaella stagnicola]|nr:hypothetical protein [Candidatus Lernaella stagnicola]